MKRWLMMFTAAGMLFSAACSQQDAEPPAEPEENQTAEKPATEQDTEQIQKAALLDLQLRMIDTIRDHIEPITTFEALEEGAENTEDARTAAETAANTTAEELRALELPADLTEENKAAMEDAKNQLADYFAARTTDAEQAEQLFTQFNEKISTTFEQNNLLAPDFSKEVQ